MEFITAKEATAILHVSVETLRRWADDGQIQTQRTKGGHRRYSKADVLALAGAAPKAPAASKVLAPVIPAPAPAAAAPIQTPQPTASRSRWSVHPALIGMLLGIVFFNVISYTKHYLHEKAIEKYQINAEPRVAIKTAFMAMKAWTVDNYDKDFLPLGDNTPPETVATQTDETFPRTVLSEISSMEPQLYLARNTTGNRSGVVAIKSEGPRSLAYCAKGSRDQRFYCLQSVNDDYFYASGSNETLTRKALREGKAISNQSGTAILSWPKLKDPRD